MSTKYFKGGVTINPHFAIFRKCEKHKVLWHHWQFCQADETLHFWNVLGVVWSCVDGAQLHHYRRACGGIAVWELAVILRDRAKPWEGTTWFQKEIRPFTSAFTMGWLLDSTQSKKYIFGPQDTQRVNMCK